MNKLPNNTRKWRKARGLTLAQLGEKIGTTHAQIRRLELGERKLTQSWMVRLAKGLDIKPIDLISETTVSAETSDAPQDKIIYWIIELCVENARKKPRLPAGAMAGIGMAVLRSAIAGKLPDMKSKMDSKKPPKSLENETQRLLDYEMNRLN